jgi:hypothetical protein
MRDAYVTVLLIASLVMASGGYANCEVNRLAIKNKLPKWSTVELLQREHQSSLQSIRLEPQDTMELAGEQLKFEVHNSYSATVCVIEVETNCTAVPQTHKLTILYGDDYCHKAQAAPDHFEIAIGPTDLAKTIE